MNKQKQLAIYLILLIALVVRIGVVVLVWNTDSDPTQYAGSKYHLQLDRDPITYLIGAQQIIATGTNKLNFFPPLHFLFMAGCLHLGNGDMLFPLFANALVSWFTVVGIYLLAKSLYGERTALYATIISGFYPNFIMYGLSLHPEMLALFWIVISFLMLVRYFHTAGFFYLMLSGALWGLASQTRGGLYIFSFFIVIAILVSLLGREPKIIVKAIGSFLVATYATIISIAIIVSPIHGDLSLNSKTGIGSVIAGVNRITTSCTDYGHIRGNIYYGTLPEDWPEGSRLNPQDLVQLKPWQIFRAVAVFISQDPLTYVKNSFNKLSCLWSPNQLIIKYIKMMGFKDSDSPIVNALCLGIGFIYVIIVSGGLCGGALAKGHFRLLFILFVLFYNILVFLAVGNSKLRLPMMPFLMIYCAYFMTSIFKSTSWRKLLTNKLFMVILVIFIGNSIYKSREFLLSPAEAYVRTIELRNELGFTKTALLSGRKNKKYNLTKNQKERMKHILRTTSAELLVRKIEHSYESGFFRKALYYIDKTNQNNFSENQIERLGIVKQSTLAEIVEQSRLAERYVKKIERFGELGYFEKVIDCLNKEVKHDFSEEQKERMRVVRRNVLAEIIDKGRKEQRNDSVSFETLRTEDTWEPSWLENHWLEAECADSIIDPLEIANDENASEGKYVFSPNGAGKQYVPGSVMALYKVTILKTGEYLLWGRVRATDGKDNSFFVQIDDGPNNFWNVEVGDHWHWDEVNNYPITDPVKFILTEGIHTIRVKLREDGTKLDKLLLTNHIDFVPKGEGN